jgi:glycosyltransferase involved in cell wall biosynthesis
MRILLCCDEPPFPPRNGVTIPPAGYAVLLKEAGHTVDCVVLEGGGAVDTSTLAETRLRMNRVFEVPRRRNSRIRRVADELLLRQPSFAAWTYPSSGPAPTCQYGTYDAIVATPIGALPFALANRAPGQRVVAAISDCYASVLFNKARLTTRTALRLATLARAEQTGKMEAKLLARCDQVIVQTELDREWLRRIGGEALFRKTSAIPNGVDVAALRGDKHQRREPTVLFIANFADPLYRANLAWFHQRVWPQITTCNPDARLRVVGKGLDEHPDIRSALVKDSSVEFLGFVSSLAQAYSGCSVVVAPIFKNHGFINKVAEAYSAGVPVVGDTSAFNGLADSLAAGCGIAADSEAAFSSAVLRLLSDASGWARAAASASRYAEQHLSWESRRNALFRAVLGDKND